MKSEMNTGNVHSSRFRAHPGAIVLDGSQVGLMRYHLHELANILTGLMITGGLLAQHLEGGSLASYASMICCDSERGCDAVCQLRHQLIAACEEQEIHGAAPEASNGTASSANEAAAAKDDAAPPQAPESASGGGRPGGGREVAGEAAKRLRRGPQDFS